MLFVPREEPQHQPAPAATAVGGELFAASKPRPVPELRFVDGAGRPRALADFRGKVVLLNLWATWCVPCRKEMPALDRLQAHLGGPDFEVVALSIDRKGLPAVQAFYAELGLKALAIYVDAKGDSANQVGALGIPTTLLIDRKGDEVGRVAGPREWDSQQSMLEIERRIGPASTAP
ncbi:MAG: TlpA family protein disulfide reductase [Geminicoccaceae bacterium]